MNKNEFSNNNNNIKIIRHIFPPVFQLITKYKGIAGNKSIEGNFLQNYSLDANGFRYGQDNELDTLKWHTPGHKFQGRFSQIYSWCLSQVWLIERVANTSLTTSIRFNQCKDLNRRGLTSITLLRDLTAYECKLHLLRGRSFHTRGRVERLLQDSKGNSYGQKSQVAKVLNNKKVSDLTSSKTQKVRKSVSLVTLVQKELQLYKNKQGIYKGLVNILKKPEFMVACYEDIKGKPGNMTIGSTKETLDGIDWNWFIKLGSEISKGKFNFSTARQVLIPKANGKTRPLGIGSPREKIVQKALAVILEQIWDKVFLDTSHGFRPNRSVHTVLKSLYLEGGNYSWVIQGDITECFPSIPHDVIMQKVQKLVRCQRTLELINKALKAGYIDPVTKKTIYKKVGTPQGSVLSPLLSNIVLHDFDVFMEKTKGDFNKGLKRKPNPEYVRLNSKRRYIRNILERKKILKDMRKLLASYPKDPNFKRLKYVRYADDFVVLVIGTYADTLKIKTQIKDFLANSCGLVLNSKKTVISNLQIDGFKFLGADCNRAKMTQNHVIKLKRNVTVRATTRLRVNIDLRKVYNKLVSSGVAKFDNNNSIIPRGTAKLDLINFSHYEIISFYNSKMRGLYTFYSFAGNRKRLNLVFWILKSSCALTLAKKYKMFTQGAIFKKYGKLLTCPETGIEIFKPDTLKAIHDYKERSVPNNLDFMDISWSTKLTESNIKRVCVLCGTGKDIEMHHLRSVKDIRQKIRTGNATFDEWSGAFKRKQIPLCKYHHDLYHSGKLSHSDLRQISNFTKFSMETYK